MSKKDTDFIARKFHIERLRDDSGEAETTYKASLSSETPVQDWPWDPPHVLRHTAEAVNLSRIGDDGLPLLNSHGVYSLENIIGRIKNVRIEKRRLVGELVFSAANPTAVQVRAMVDEGTITDMSIGARIEKIKRIENDGKTESIEVLRWTPIEASVVTIGGDHAVGIGRSTQAAETVEEAITMGKEKVVAGDTAAEETTEETGAIQRISIGREAIDEGRAIKLEENRQKAIRNLAEANSIGEDTVQEWITRGYNLDTIADNILAIHKSRGENNASQAHLGLSANETREYSLCRAILAAHSRNWKNAGFELECHDEVAKRINAIPEVGNFFVPLDVQQRSLPTNINRLAQKHGLGHLQRDLHVATDGAGGFLTQTTNMGFTELLRAISFAFRMGVTRLSGLRDNVAIPRQSAAATAEWLTSETDTAAESQQTFVQLLMSPKTVSAYTELSRQLLLQATIDAEGLVNSDLAAVAALAVDAAVISGSGAAGQPEGLDNVVGVGAVVGTTLGFPGVLEFQTDVAAANVLPAAGGYVTTPAVASLMIQRVKYASTASPLWEGNIWEGVMQGFNAMSTNQVAAAVMYFGDWAKAIVAEWGVLEVETNPFANFPAGIIGVRAMYSVDVGIRLPAAFSRADTIT